MKKSPNLVFVFADQYRPFSLGFLGQDPVRTPYLDRFAGEAVYLSDAVSTHPVCSPYRAMMLTGKYPVSNHVPYNCYTTASHLDNELQESDRCISDVLFDCGYSLGYIGKWHLDNPVLPYIDENLHGDGLTWNEYCSPHRRHHFDFWYSYGTDHRHLSPMYWIGDASRTERVTFEGEWSPEHEAGVAIDYIQNKDKAYRDEEKPFALFVSFNPPHTPYPLVPEKYKKLYEDMPLEQALYRENIDLTSNSPTMAMVKEQIRNYYAAITGVDEQFGRILAALDEQGLSEETIVVFTADHGNCMGEHDFHAKSLHWEECFRVPFLIRYGSKLKSRTDNLLFSPPDIMPTLLSLMGQREQIPKEVEGIDYSDAIKGEENAPRPTSALYFLPPYPLPKTYDLKGGRRGVRTHRYTLVTFYEKGEMRYQLYDNKNDPYQLKDIAPKRKDLIDLLVNEELIPHLRRTADPFLELLLPV